MSKSKLKKTLGVIQEVDQKNNNPYNKIINLFTASGQFLQQNANILQQLDNFHQFYNCRFQQEKQMNQKLREQNLEHATKIIKYERVLQNYQVINHELRDQISVFELKLSEKQKDFDDKVSRLMAVLNKKDQEIKQLKFQLLKYAESKNINMGSTKQGYLSKQQLTKKKVVRLKQRSVREEEQRNYEGYMTHREVYSLKHQNQQYIHEIQGLTRENERLRNKIKHLETDRKYEDQRLKNATLNFELDIRIKNQRIQRLNQQLQIYQSKFNELLETCKNSKIVPHNLPFFHSSNTSSNFNSVNNSLIPNSHCTSAANILQIDKQINPSHDFKDESNDYQKNFQKRERMSYQQKQKLKLAANNKDLTVKIEDKSHKRHNSSQTDEHRKQNKKEDLNLKIKVVKYNGSGNRSIHKNIKSIF